MDVEELLNYQPSRSVEDGNEEEESNKRFKSDHPLSNRNLYVSDKGASPLDESALKKLLLQFERKVLKNQELRIKFVDNPTKFMDSEMELFDIIQELNIITTQPELYRFIVELNIVPTFLNLLLHENVDISCAILSLIQEITDIDDNNEIKHVEIILDALISGSLIPQLVSNLDRLDETIKEEYEGVYNSLAIIENLSEYKPEINKDCKYLILWILQRFKAKTPFDGNKLYSSEILSILLQSNDENKVFLGEANGIDTILKQIAYYKRHDPSSADENEYMENLFDCLCSCLLFCPQNRLLFYKGEGIELMNLIMKEKSGKKSHSSVKMCSLKVLNHILSGDSDPKNENPGTYCNKFVEILGLRVLFPAFLKPRSIIHGYKKKEAKDAVDDVEEHCVSILCGLLKHCKGEIKKRVVKKFYENDFEKMERLLEIHFKYADRLNRCNLNIEHETKTGILKEDLTEDNLFMRRLTEGGLFTLQMTDCVIVLTSSLTEDVKILKERIIKILNMHSTPSLDHHKLIKSTLKSMASEMNDKNESKTLIQLVKDF